MDKGYGIPAQSLSPETLLQILEVTRQLARPFDLQTLLAEVGRAAESVLRAERATVWLFDPADGTLVLSGADVGGGVQVSVEQGLLGRCARNREVVNVRDVEAHPDFDPAADLDRNNDVRCLLSIPLIDGDELVGVLQVVDKVDGFFSEEDEHVAVTLAAHCVVAIQRERMTRAMVRAEKLDREIALAREIQISTLPPEMPVLPGYDVAAAFRPADQTGGDTYDLVRLDADRLFMLLGDASGHGIGPALSATQMTAMLRVALRLGADLDSVFNHINNQLVEDLPEEHFITAFLGILDTRRHEATFHSGGQGPLLHYQARTGEFRWMAPSTYPLGFVAYPTVKPAEVVSFGPGDILGLISDGVYEYGDAEGKQFGMEGVEQVVRAYHDRPMSELLETLVAEAQHFAGGEPQQDDVTLVLLRRTTEHVGAVE